LNSLSQNEAEQAITDEELMLTYAKGEAWAFDQLYQRHKVAVYRFFVRQNTSLAIAEELCHDTWLKVINARTSYQTSALFRTYLFTIARRVLIDFSQKKSTINEKASIDDDLFIATEQCNKGDFDNELKQMPDSAQLIQQTQLKQALKNQIEKLSFEQKQVFLLKQEAGFTIEQIAKITEQHKEKVKSSWRYALQKMREGLSAYVK